MCRQGLATLVCGIDDDDDESNSRGIGSIGVDGLFLKAKMRVQLMLKALASCF
jgi:hypothetical protein